jgi:hypothetical protein
LEDWALSRGLAGEGVPKARIAERLGISRTTVIKAVNSESPPRYGRAPRAGRYWSRMPCRGGRGFRRRGVTGVAASAMIHRLVGKCGGS